AVRRPVALLEDLQRGVDADLLPLSLDELEDGHRLVAIGAGVLPLQVHTVRIASLGQELFRLLRVVLDDLAVLVFGEETGKRPRRRGRRVLAVERAGNLTPVEAQVQ